MCIRMASRAADFNNTNFELKNTVNNFDNGQMGSAEGKLFSILEVSPVLLHPSFNQLLLMAFPASQHISVENRTSVGVGGTFPLC